MWILEDKLRKIKERLGENGFWLRPRQRSLELCKKVIRTFTDYTRDPNVMLDTRRAIAEEIEALDSKPFMIVQTSPAEGTIIHGDPRCIAIRGLVSPDAKVTIYGNLGANHDLGLRIPPEGDPVIKINPNGYFAVRRCLLDDEPVLNIVVEDNGKKRTVTRTFTLMD